jgi:hypothetical protein
MLGSITGENHQDWDFGGRQLLFVDDLLQLPSGGEYGHSGRSPFGHSKCLSDK